jgi:hypothetical protein
VEGSRRAALGNGCGEALASPTFWSRRSSV